MIATLFAILGLLLKLIGICLAVPKAVKDAKNWKLKQVSLLYEQNFVFRKTGRKPTVAFWKRTLYKWARMPMPHLWKIEKTDRPGEE